MLPTWTLVLACVQIAGCDTQERGLGIRASHPVEDSLLSSSIGDRLSTVRRGPDGDLSIVDSAVLVFGTENGPPNTVIGDPADAVLGRELLTILDQSIGDIIAVDVEAGRGARIGRAGRGPGELVVPRAVALHGDSTLLVADEDRRILRFRRGSSLDSAWVYEATIGVEMVVLDLCVLADAFYVLGLDPDESGVIHRFGHAGERLGPSFGSPYRHSNLDLRYLFADGRLVCDEGRGMVYLASRVIPEVYAFTAAGELEWVVRFADNQPMDVLELDDGIASGMAEGTSEMHLLQGLELLRGERLLVQYGRYTRSSMAEGGEAEAHEMYLIDPGTAEGVFVGDHPHRLMASRRDLVVFLEEDPFPRLKVHRLGGVWPR